MAATPPFTMLTSGICSAYRAGVTALQQHSEVELLAHQTGGEGVSGVSLAKHDDSRAGAALFQTDINSFLKDPGLSAEVFGPATLLIKYSSVEQLAEIARSLEGQLTATIHASEAELKQWNELIGILEQGGPITLQWISYRCRSWSRDGSWWSIPRHV